MEVASPLAFAPSAAGSKRPLACSPSLLLDATTQMETSEDLVQPAFKRRRFIKEPATDKLAIPSPFLSVQNKAIFNSPVTSLKRLRERASPSPSNELAKVVEEQAGIIESLKKDKASLESSFTSLKTDHDRVVKENQILRRGFNIQQAKQNQAENELKAAHQYRNNAEDKMKKLEQVVTTLRYHLQAQQQPLANDFLHHRPPDVF